MRVKEPSKESITRNVSLKIDLKEVLIIPTNFQRLIWVAELSSLFIEYSSIFSGHKTQNISPKTPQSPNNQKSTNTATLTESASVI